MDASRPGPPPEFRHTRVINLHDHDILSHRQRTQAEQVIVGKPVYTLSQSPNGAQHNRADAKEGDQEPLDDEAVANPLSEASAQFSGGLHGLVSQRER